ncbi:MAG TPA: PLP-dependent aminotransferase family protein [Chroococcales cyanobacterium]
MDLLINLDSASTVPLHRQVYEEIRGAILSGRLASGKKVPSTRALAESLGVSRATITLSYECLLSEGYLEAFTGAGTFVCRELPEDLLQVESDEFEDAFESGAAIAEQLISPDGDIREQASEAPKPVKKIRHKRLSVYGDSLKQKDWMAFTAQEPEIQFSYGRPDLSEFPMRLWMQLYQMHSKKRNLTELDSPSNARGYLPLRQALADYVGRSRAVTCSPDQIIVINGSQQGINLVTRILVDRGDFVGVEEPGYLGAQKALLAQGAVLVPFHVDNNGLRLDELKSRFAVNSENPLKLIYVTPSHQYPTGVVLSLPRRLEMLKWAHRTGSYIIEDDYDSEFRYKGRPIPALAAVDKDGSVIYIGTFSKTLLPALRLGYLVVPEELVDVFARAKWLADRHSPLLDQQVLADFINQGHLDRHIRKMRSIYSVRRKLFVETLKKYFGNRISIHGDNAGINVLVRFDTHLSDKDLVERARKLGVGLTSTAQLYVGEPRHGEFLLNYGGLSDEQITDGVDRLAHALA